MIEPCFRADFCALFKPGDSKGGRGNVTDMDRDKRCIHNFGWGT